MPNSGSDHPSRFKFHEWGRFVRAAAAGSLLILLIAVVTLSRRQFDLEVFLLVWSGSWFYLVIATAFVINNSDLVVDDRGITRVLFDHVGHRVRWTNIELVREYSLRDNGRNARCIQIVLSRGHFFAWQLYRKMVVTDSMDHFDEFIELLNKRIAGQPVKVELRINGQWQPQSRLVTDF
jgi:hypothetical protein